PVAASAGLATLNVLAQPDVYDGLNALGASLRERTEAVLRNAGHEAHVIGVGPVYQIVFTDRKPRNYRDMKAADTARLRSLTSWLLQNGVLYSGKKGYLSVAHIKDDVDRFVEMVAQWSTITGAGKHRSSA